MVHLQRHWIFRLFQEILENGLLLHESDGVLKVTESGLDHPFLEGKHLVPELQEMRPNHLELVGQINLLLLIEGFELAENGVEIARLRVHAELLGKKVVPHHYAQQQKVVYDFLNITLEDLAVFQVQVLSEERNEHEFEGDFFLGASSATVDGLPVGEVVFLPQNDHIVQMGNQTQ